MKKIKPIEKLLIEREGISMLEWRYAEETMHKDRTTIYQDLREIIEIKRASVIEQLSDPVAVKAYKEALDDTLSAIDTYFGV